MILIILSRILSRLLTRIRALRQRRLIIAASVVVVLGLGAFLTVLLTAPRSSSGLASAIEVSVDGIEQNPSNGQIMVALKEKAANRRLTMVIGDTEARTIFAELRGLRSERPLTYDLMRDLLQSVGARVDHVLVNSVTDSTYFAKVVLASEGRQIEVESRPSDAIALALRSRAPIYVNASVLDKAGVSTPR